MMCEAATPVTHATTMIMIPFAHKHSSTSSISQRWPTHTKTHGDISFGVTTASTTDSNLTFVLESLARAFACATSHAFCRNLHGCFSVHFRALFPLQFFLFLVPGGALRKAQKRVKRSQQMPVRNSLSILPVDEYLRNEVFSNKRYKPARKDGTKEQQYSRQQSAEVASPWRPRPFRAYLRCAHLELILRYSEAVCELTKNNIQHP